MDRPSQECAVLIALELRDRLLRRIKEVLGIESSVAEVFIEAAVKLLAPAAGGHLDLRPYVAAELGAVAARLYLKLVDQLHRRADDDPVDEPIVVVHAVQKKIIG